MTRVTQASSPCRDPPTVNDSRFQTPGCSETISNIQSLSRSLTNNAGKMTSSTTPASCSCPARLDEVPILTGILDGYRELCTLYLTLMEEMGVKLDRPEDADSSWQGFRSWHHTVRRLYRRRSSLQLKINSVQFRKTGYADGSTQAFSDSTTPDDFPVSR